MSETIGFAVSFGVFFGIAFYLVDRVRRRRNQEDTPAGDEGGN